jgi:hypothetical protein
MGVEKPIRLRGRAMAILEKKRYIDNGNKINTIDE